MEAQNTLSARVSARSTCSPQIAQEVPSRFASARTEVLNFPATLTLATELRAVVDDPSGVVPFEQVDRCSAKSARPRLLAHAVQLGLLSTPRRAVDAASDLGARGASTHAARAARSVPSPRPRLRLATDPPLRVVRLAELHLPHGFVAFCDCALRFALIGAEARPLIAVAEYERQVLSARFTPAAKRVAGALQATPVHGAEAASVVHSTASVDGAEPCLGRLHRSPPIASLDLLGQAPA